jgi:hypothetical protein
LFFNSLRLCLQRTIAACLQLKYYRSLALQSTGTGFFTEPVNIIGNIENGYGGFMVHSVREFPLLDDETYHTGYYHEQDW